MASINFFTELNVPQKQAVDTTEGPLLILAGAGAGKTKTLTFRMLNLIRGGVDPRHILAITFTNKAAQEMKERVLSLIASDPQVNRPLGFHERPFVGTFHSLCVNIIKENAGLLGTKRHFSIYDRDDSKKVVRDALKHLGYDPKEYDPNRILSIISREKGNLVSRDEYTAREGGDYIGSIVGKVWGKYDAALRKENAYDFDDLLCVVAKLLKENAEVRKGYSERWKYIHIDEYQDTNEVQYEIMKLLSWENRNVCAVGDVDQCLVGDSMVTMADGSRKKIADIKAGELVISNYGSGKFKPAQVERKRSKIFNGQLIRIETMGGRVIESTPEHMHFAGYRLGTTPQIYFNYLMRKSGVGWRIGTSCVYTNGQKKPVVGFVQRCNQEHADAAWVIATHPTEQEARINEYILSLKHQIPTLPFTPRKGLSKNGYVHDPEALKKVFDSIDTEKHALLLLALLGFSTEYPHHRPQSSSSKRRNINITLCADKRGENPMHLISMFGNDPNDRAQMASHGLSVRVAKNNTENWRFETVYADFDKVLATAEKIKTIFPDAHLTFRARLGGKKINPMDGNSLPFMPAASIMPGMALFNSEGDYEVVSKVSRLESKKIKVFDLDIKRTHNFIANDILTHNCIYSWRGANIKNILNFEKDYPEGKVIVLEENYRSTQTILAIANRVIEKNKMRRKKTLFTSNGMGDKVGLFEALDEAHEASYVANKIKTLNKSGTPLSQIAVLYRANFQSRALEEAMLRAEVSYQVLGTRFFDRKEVKDVISFLRLALNPESVADLARVINVPPRGIGKVTLLKIVEGKEEALPAKVRQKVAQFRQILMKIKNSAISQKPSETLRLVIEASGLSLALSKNDDDNERVENLKELLALATRYDELPPEEGIEAMLADVSLASDQDSQKDSESVRLMTVHASKGLEFDCVFVTGLEEGLFPSDKNRDKRVSDEEAEEERRLFYVAVTRARKKLFLTYAQTRTVFGSRGVNIPSEFIFELDDNLVERDYLDYPPQGDTGRRHKPLLEIEF